MVASWGVWSTVTVAEEEDDRAARAAALPTLVRGMGASWGHADHGWRSTGPAAVPAVHDGVEGASCGSGDGSVLVWCSRRRGGHGADVDDEPDPCKVMAWGVNVRSKPCLARGGDRRQVQVACVRACMSVLRLCVCVACVSYWSMANQGACVCALSSVGLGR